MLKTIYKDYYNALLNQQLVLNKDHDIILCSPIVYTVISALAARW